MVILGPVVLSFTFDSVAAADVVADVQAKPRQLHNTHWGFICPAETPEGQAVGLVKNLALMAYISVGCSLSPILVRYWKRSQFQGIVLTSF